MKTMDMDEITREIPVMITRETLTLMDRRTGRIETRDFYRPGKEFPIAAMRHLLNDYGYDILSHTKSGTVCGTMDLEILFATLNADTEVMA